MASTYLTRTNSSTSSTLTKGTFSAWVKRSAPSGEQTLFTGNDSANTYRDFVRFEANSQLRVRAAQGSFNLETTAAYRDVNGWYHIVAEIDTTLATSTDRVKVYVNGERVTAFNTPTYPSQNYTLTGWSNNTLQTVGRDGKDNNTPFDGSMAHVHWIDGTAYDASYFGSTDATTGIWKPNTAPNVTYGTNGFFLKFANSGSMGTDSSGNGNNFSVNGNLTQTQDTPSNVFATLNGISGYGSFSNGNLKYTTTTTDGEWSTSTLSISTGGKWYCEAKMISITGGAQYHAGITNINAQNFTYRVLWRGDGAVYVGGSQTNTFGTYTTNDIIGMAYDASTRQITFYKNGVSAGTVTAPALPSGGDYFFGSPSLSGGNTYVTEWNFGNGYFGTTAVASGNADDNGLGIFEYTPPTGYYSLCTKNINEFAYD